MIDMSSNGTDDTMWKVAGRAGLGDHDAYSFLDIAEDTTTLYDSDRNVFLFLVDDIHPIDARKLGGRIARPGTFEASIVGTRTLYRRPSASLHFTFGRCA